MRGPAKKFAGGPTARYWFMGSAFFLTAVGLVMIYSASSITAAVREGSSTHYFVRQLVFIGIGVFISAVLARFDYRALRLQAKNLWYGSMALLVLVLVIGAVRGGAKRWIPLGLFNLQPSELAKIACVLLVAAFAIDWQRNRIPKKTLLWDSLVATAVPVGLIMLQPDMGTMVTLIIGVAFVLVLAGIELKWMILSLLTTTGLGVIFIMISDYRRARVLGFMDPFADAQGKGYQIVQALYAFGSGGVDGVGLGLSRQKFFYLPEAHTDFVLAIIGEEIGLLGTLAIVVAFGIFVWSGFKIAAGAKDGYGRLVAGSLTGLVGFQAFLNMAAVTNMTPVTGKPLPFVSYGGSSMIVTMICVGIILSVANHGAYAPRAVRSKQPSSAQKAVRPKRAIKENARESVHERRRDGGARVSGSDSRGRARRRA